MDGDDVGGSEGFNVGSGVGISDGGAVGSGVGIAVGAEDGIEVGSDVGMDDGSAEGRAEGMGEGSEEGNAVGVFVAPERSRLKVNARPFVSTCVRPTASKSWYATSQVGVSKLTVGVFNIVSIAAVRSFRVFPPPPVEPPTVVPSDSSAENAK